MLFRGASGFSYNDWVGNFYPIATPKRERITYYAREFNTCEINSTFYALPKPSSLKAMAEKTGEGFLFCFKANQEMTHQRKDNVAIFKAFHQVLETITVVGKLGCILTQFPYSFRFNHHNWDYLALFRKRLGKLPIVIEFCNAQWLRSEVFDWLRQQDLSFCCVDEPRLPNLLPPLADVTSQIGYVRLHGHNSVKWWQHEHAYERCDYSYSPSELTNWLPKIQKLNSVTEKTSIFANNHWRGQAIDAIRQLRTMLD